MIDIEYYCDTRRRAAKGWPMKMVIRMDRARVMVSTGIYSDKDWTGAFSKGEPERMQKEMALARIRQAVLMELQKHPERGMAAKVVKEIADLAIRGKSMKLYVEYAKQFGETHENPHTKNLYDRHIKLMNSYDPTATLDSITEGWLEDFEAYARKKGWKTNYYGKTEREIRAVMRWACKHRYTDNDPFRWFKCKGEKTRKRNLKLDEVRTLRDYPVEEWQERYRDTFMLMIYMQGIDIVDLMHLPKLKKGQTHVDFERTKSGGFVHCKLEPEAMEIIKRYEGREYMLRFMDEQKDYENFMHRMNKALKEIGEMKRVGRGGRKVREPLFPDLTTKWARHTWATLAAGLDGVTTSEVGIGLGHMDALTADIYIEVDFEKAERLNRRVLDLIAGKEEDKKETLEERVKRLESRLG